MEPLVLFLFHSPDTTTGLAYDLESDLPDEPFYGDLNTFTWKHAFLKLMHNFRKQPIHQHDVETITLFYDLLFRSDTDKFYQSFTDIAMRINDVRMQKIVGLDIAASKFFNVETRIPCKVLEQGFNFLKEPLKENRVIIIETLLTPFDNPSEIPQISAGNHNISVMIHVENMNSIGFIIPEPLKTDITYLRELSVKRLDTNDFTSLITRIDENANLQFAIQLMLLRNNRFKSKQKRLHGIVFNKKVEKTFRELERTRNDIHDDQLFWSKEFKPFIHHRLNRANHIVNLFY